MLRSYPHLEDPDATAGGDTTALQSGKARPKALVDTRPPGENADFDGRNLARSLGLGTIGLENSAQDHAVATGGGIDQQPETNFDFLSLVRQAEDNAMLYVAQANRKAWSMTYRAFHGEHYHGSKYTRNDWRGRSKLFVPKTRAAVRKDNAAVAASMFNSVDAISCSPGNDADPRQRGGAKLMAQIVNLRTGGRAPGPGSMPWFLICMGARQDSVLTGVCVSKQYWLKKFRKVREETVEEAGENGEYEQRTRDVYEVTVNRPDVTLFPPENIIIDSAANWLNPAQSASFLILKYPMTVEEIKDKQDAPINPWKQVPEGVLRSSLEAGKFDTAAIRRARELGLDRLDETQTGPHFQIVWVYEVFIRVDGEDWSFYSLGTKDYLTDPKPTREVYPEQHGERPVSMGYGSLESHRIFPMAPAESWQPLQIETNDIRNLMLDATKQNVMPITKVVRGRRIDLDQIRRRSSGTSILVDSPEDVTFENAPQLNQGAVEMQREIDLEFDDLAGQQNYGTVENNNAVGKTLGGLKLAAGSANAVQEFDIRLWIETWANATLQQIVHLEQYYEEDPVILAIAGQKAQLWQKFGISQIDDELMSQDVTVQVSVGLGAGDPMQRLAKFETAAQIVAPILQQAPDFASGKKEIDVDAVIEEVFGAVGYKDAGSRFFKDNGQARPNPMMDLQTKKLMAEIQQRERQGKGSLFQGLASLAKVSLGRKELEAEVVDMLLGHQRDARQMGFDHAHRHMDQHLSALDHGHRHGLAVTDQRHQHSMDLHNAASALAGSAVDDRNLADEAGGDAGMDAAAQTGPTSGAPSGAAPQAPPSASPPTPSPQQAIMDALASGQLQFTRGRDGRINGVKHAGAPAPAAAAAAPAAPDNKALRAEIAKVMARLGKPKSVVRDTSGAIVGVR